MKTLKIALVIIIFILISFTMLDARLVVEERGGRVKVVKFSDGTWQLMVDEKPYFIKGVVFTPVKIGENPDNATMRDWMYYDEDKDGRNDIAYQSWLDENKNNKKDSGEEEEGDFKFLKEMGCNTIRLYHVPSNNPILGDIYKENPATALQFAHPVNKELLRKLYKDYGIMVIMGNFLGSWTIGSGIPWEEGTDYTNPKHRKNIKESVRAMVLDNKDEPYVLLWLLGNENNIASWSQCNGWQEPVAYATLVGEITEMIHELDPDHPVAVCDGDNFHSLKQYSKYAKNLDIIAYNCYRGRYGFGHLWQEAEDIFDRPIFISEFGMFTYNIKSGENENLQREYLKGCWRDIVLNSAWHYNPKKMITGNSIGGVVFDWVDRWYMDGFPDKHNKGARHWNSPDGYLHEEWFGLMSMGNGSDWLMRQRRKAYNYFKDVWNQKNPSF